MTIRKSDYNFTRYFGIELEYAVNESLLASAAKQAILRHSDHALRSFENSKCWSVKSEHCGSEITTPKLEFTKANLDMVCKIVNEIGQHLRKHEKQHCFIKNNCGLHLHVDSCIKNTGKNEKQAWLRFFSVFRAMEYPMFSIVPRCRRRNRHIAMLRHEYPDFLSYVPDYKYLSTNLTDSKHVEIRHAQSTLDGNYLFQWSALSKTMIEIAEGFAFKKFNKNKQFKYVYDDIPKAPTRNYVKNIINFIKENKDYIKTQWLKYNMEQMFNWIKKEHEKNSCKKN